jgi:hypothetical protein
LNCRQYAYMHGRHYTSKVYQSVPPFAKAISTLKSNMGSGTIME